MTSLWITIPATLLLAATLVALVVRAARRGEYDDWEGPAARMLHDDDSQPELEGEGPGPDLG
jgi:cbb3-type cytochrome oxidase maturation protein